MTETSLTGSNILTDQTKIRDIAIIAHVDHGKTTLVDAFLKQCHVFRDNSEEMDQEQIMDSGELEREKGITIKAKNASVFYKGYRINIIDTPGHADFGGEVERTLHMADGCLLLIDAQEGPMPQTKFVLKKALELKLKPIVVMNKIDKKHANTVHVLNKLNDLFLSLVDDIDQLDFPVLYAIAREGKVFTEIPAGDLTVAGSTTGNLDPLLDCIITNIPAPDGDSTKPFQMLISSVEFDAHIGRLLVGKISSGQIKLNDNIAVCRSVADDETDTFNNVVEVKGQVKKIFTRVGLGYKEITTAGPGDIVAIAGLDSTAIGATLCKTDNLIPLPEIKISPPAVQIKFEANNSPLVGKEGTFVTAKQVQQRLEKELENNISLKITKGEGGSYFVAGRGELQLSILIETMRREGFEFQIRRPEVVLQEQGGKKMEPLEELVIEVPEEYLGVVTSTVGTRNAKLLNLESENGNSKFTYQILTRNLLGLRGQLLTATKGNVVMNSYLLDYVEYTHQPELFRKGVLIASEAGVAIGYSMNTAQERGELFIEPATTVYEGMIIGINKFENDLYINVTKERQKSGYRIKHDEITQTTLRNPIALTLEFALSFLAKDEILEITPKNLRLRKIHLSKMERELSQRGSLSSFAKQKLGVA